MADTPTSQPRHPSFTVHAASEVEKDAFLTHDWGLDELGRNNHERVSSVNIGLQAAGIVTWFDEDEMRGDVRKKMALGVEFSRVLIVFITERYVLKASGMGDNGANDNCKFEFDSAQLAPHIGVEQMIAVVMEPRCLIPGNWPPGAVKGLLGGTLFIDLSAEADSPQFASGVTKLAAEIFKRLDRRSPALKGMPPSAHPASAHPAKNNQQLRSAGTAISAALRLQQQKRYPRSSTVIAAALACFFAGAVSGGLAVHAGGLPYLGGSSSSPETVERRGQAKRLSKLHQTTCFEQPDLCGGRASRELVHGGTLWLLNEAIDPIAHPLVFDEVLDEVQDHGARPRTRLTKHVMRRLHSAVDLPNSASALEAIRARAAQARRRGAPISELELRILTRPPPAKGWRYVLFVRQEVLESLAALRKHPLRVLSSLGTFILVRSGFSLGLLGFAWVVDKLDLVIRVTSVLHGAMRRLTLLRAVTQRLAAVQSQLFRELQRLHH